jgi:hypothetical protein
MANAGMSVIRSAINASLVISQNSRFFSQRTSVAAALAIPPASILNGLFLLNAPAMA